MSKPVIVVGGGLSGLSAAHTVLQAGGSVVLVDKKAILGGNSTKATSGINGAGTRTQKAMAVEDSKEVFEEDTARSATGIKKGPAPQGSALGRVLTHESADAVHWLIDQFGLVLDTVSRLGGHSFPRTHRSKSGGKFPGMMITYRLMVVYDEICQAEPNRAKLINRARVNKLLTDDSGAVIGIQYEADGKNQSLYGSAVVLATGGYGAGVLDKNSYLNDVRPDLMHLPTTNGDHCTGDAIKFATAIGAGVVDAKAVQVHPTGLVHPADPDARVKFLAAGALRGEGAIILDRNGKRFCDELGTRDYVSGEMFKNQGPFRLILNSECASGIDWHCRHYIGRGVMKHVKTGADLAKEIGCSVDTLNQTFADYNRAFKEKNDVHGRKFFNGMPWTTNDNFYVAQVTPIVHYTMGGLHISPQAQVLTPESKPITGLYAAGEVTGGVHGKNRLGGSALLECVVYGRKAGSSVVSFLKSSGAFSSGSGGPTVTITIQQPSGHTTTVVVSGGSAQVNGAAAAAPTAAAAPASAPAPAADKKEFTLEEVAKHATEDDCWVAVNGQVLDVTKFLPDHPGGKMAILTFAGKDASEEFNMLHEKTVIAKYAPETVIGTLKGLQSKL